MIGEEQESETSQKGTGEEGKIVACSSLESYEVPHLKVRMGVKN